MYCGSNSLSTDLIANGGNKVVGTRYGCMKKGIGVGLHMPVDPNFNGNYAPLDPRKFYCGDGALPAGYFADGTLQQCFTKGVGVGRKMAARAPGAGGAAAPLAPVAAPLAPVAAPLAPVAAPLDPVAAPLAAPLAPVAPLRYRWLTYFLFYGILNAAFILGMVYGKPKFIMDANKEIDWNILSPYIALFMLVTGGIFYHRFTIY